MSAPADTQHRRRHRRRRALIATAVVLVVLVVTAVVLDNVARGYAESAIQAKVRTALTIPATTPVNVKVDGTSVLYQLATGRLQRVEVGLPKVSVGALAGEATLRLDGIPTDQTKPIGGATLVFSTGEAGLRSLLKSFSGIPVTSVAIVSGAVQVGGKLTLLGIGIPVKVAFAPSASNGRLTITPLSFDVNGATVTAAQLSAILGPLASRIVAKQSLCVANLLPKALHLDALSISGTKVKLVVSLGSVALEGKSFSTMGSCS